MKEIFPSGSFDNLQTKFTNKFTNKMRKKTVSEKA